MPRLGVVSVTPELFADFGQLIAAEGRAHYAINDGTAERYHDLADIDVAEAGGRPSVSLVRAQPRALPLRLTMVERHPLGSQAFIPLSKSPFLVVVASCEGAPMPGDLRAFAVGDGTGVNFAKGIWHHPLLALDRVSDFLVIDRAGPGENCEECRLREDVLLDWPERA